MLIVDVNLYKNCIYLKLYPILLETICKGVGRRHHLSNFSRVKKCPAGVRNRIKYVIIFGVIDQVKDGIILDWSELHGSPQGGQLVHGRGYSETSFRNWRVRVLCAL